MDYFHTQTQGITSGTKYIVHEHDRYITLLEGGTTFKTVIRGSFIAQGSDVNTYITMYLVTSIDENGNPHTIVDKVVVKCLTHFLFQFILYILHANLKASRPSE